MCAHSISHSLTNLHLNLPSSILSITCVTLQSVSCLLANITVSITSLSPPLFSPCFTPEEKKKECFSFPFPLSPLAVSWRKSERGKKLGGERDKSKRIEKEKKTKKRVAVDAGDDPFFFICIFVFFVFLPVLLCLLYLYIRVVRICLSVYVLRVICPHLPPHLSFFACSRHINKSWTTSKSENSLLLKNTAAGHPLPDPNQATLETLAPCHRPPPPLQTPSHAFRLYHVENQECVFLSSFPLSPVFYSFPHSNKSP